MKEKEIIECLIEYSKRLLEKYKCITNVQFIERYKIKFFLINEKLALTYIVDLTGNCNVIEEFNKMIDYYKEKCTKWCGGVKDDTE